MSTHPRAVEAIASKAIADRVFPGIVIEAGRTNGRSFTFTAGSQTYDAGATRVDPRTNYDLASLTKVIATAALMAGEVASGRMRLDDRVRRWIDGWTSEDRQAVT